MYEMKKNLIKLESKTPEDKSKLNEFIKEFHYTYFEDYILNNLDVTVETTFVSGYGNFIWKISKRSKGQFEIPLSDQRLEHSWYFKDTKNINEYFEIEFVVKEIEKNKNEIDTLVNSEPQHHIGFLNQLLKPSLEIQDISFNVNKDSSLTYSELISATNYEVCVFLHGCMKDFIIIPTKHYRQKYPYDLKRAIEESNKEYDEIMMS
jgi:hypothetical protein